MESFLKGEPSAPYTLDSSSQNDGWSLTEEMQSNIWLTKRVFQRGTSAIKVLIFLFNSRNLNIEIRQVRNAVNMSCNIFV